MPSELNLPCPYKVFRIDEANDLAHYEFSTSSGLVYYIHFDSCDLFPEVISEDNVFSFSFGPKSDLFSYDENVKKTIIEVIKFFFSTRENVLLFTCDPSDGRAQLRQRLFSIWHDTYATDTNTVKVNTTLATPDPEDEDYLCSLIIRKDHPNFQECIQAYKSFNSYINSLK